MDRRSINQTIIHLSTTYESLNQHWEDDPCSENRHQVFRQEEYKNIFETLDQCRFEELVLQVVSENLSKTVLARLQTLIERNIRIYETKKDVFNKLDFRELCRVDEQQEFDIRAQSFDLS